MNAYRWSDLRPGLEAGFQVTVDAAMLAAFRDLSGDHNPLHADPAFAAAQGHPDLVVHGLLTASFYSRLVGHYLPGRYALLHGLQVDFTAPVLVGTTLQVHGEVTALVEAYRRLELRARIHDGEGRLVSRARITVGLHEA